MKAKYKSEIAAAAGVSAPILRLCIYERIASGDKAFADYKKIKTS